MICLPKHTKANYHLIICCKIISDHVISEYFALEISFVECRDAPLAIGKWPILQNIAIIKICHELTDNYGNAL